MPKFQITLSKPQLQFLPNSEHNHSRRDTDVHRQVILNSYMFINIQLFWGATKKITHNLYIKMIFICWECISLCTGSKPWERCILATTEKYFSRSSDLKFPDPFGCKFHHKDKNLLRCKKEKEGSMNQPCFANIIMQMIMFCL